MAKQKPKFRNNSGIYGIDTKKGSISKTGKKSKYKAGADLSHPIK